MKLFILFIAFNLSSLTFVQAQAPEISKVENLKILAEQGDAEAQFNLGNIYYTGEGVTQDYELAFEWYQKAAHQGHTKAQFNLGTMYYNGQGAPRSLIYSYAYVNLVAAKRLHYAVTRDFLEEKNEL